TATAITTAALALRAVQTGQKTPEEPAFRRHTKKMPNMAPHTVPYTTPRSAGRSPRNRVPAAFAGPRAGVPRSRLTSTVAIRHTAAPMYTSTPRCSPDATATPTGSTVDTSADTGATTLIGPAARPV